MDFSSSTQAAHEQTACQINFAELLKRDPHIRHLPTQLALAFGIASAGRDPTSMCGASASDDSTWTQRSSLR